MLVAGLDQLFEGGSCGLRWDEGLDLDEAPEPVGVAPSGNVVEEKGKAHVTLLEGGPGAIEQAGGPVLGGVDQAHAEVIDPGLEQAPHQPSWDHAKEAIGKGLVAGIEGVCSRRVTLYGHIVGSVDSR